MKRLVLLLLLLLAPMGARSQFLLPNAEQTFLDQNGAPLAGGKVYTYVPGTTTPKTTWVDQGLTTANTNPITLDAAGRAIIWGTGLYREIVQDLNGNQAWDQTTSAAQGVTGPGSSIVGDVACWANTFGSSLSDCIALSALATLNSPTFTGIPNTTTDGGNNSSPRIASEAWVFAFYAPLSNPNLTGIPIAPTASPGTNSAQLATTAFVQAAQSASTVSPAFSGVPTAPTAPYLTNSTQLATTAFVNQYAPVLGATHPSVQTGSFTVSNNVLNDHAFFFLQGGAAGQAMTVGGLSAYTVDPFFSVGVCNQASRRWTLTGGDSGSQYLYPGQCNFWVSNGGTLQFGKAQERYKLPNATLFVGISGCNDGNDGQANGQPFCHVNSALSELLANYDLSGTNPTIQLADGTYSEAINISGPAGVGWKDGINLTGDVAVPTNVLLQGNSGSNPVFARDLSIVFLNSLELSCVAPVAPCVNVSQNSVVDFTNVTIGSATGQNMITIQSGGHADLDGGFTISGNAATVFDAVGSNAFVEATNQTITYTGTPHWSAAFAEIDGSGAGMDFSGSNFSGTGATGNRATVANNGELRTGSNCTTATLNSFTFLPGNSNTAGINGGICD